MVLQTLFIPWELVSNVHNVVLNVFCVKGLLMRASPRNTLGSMLHATISALSSVL